MRHSERNVSMFKRQSHRAPTVRGRMPVLAIVSLGLLLFQTAYLFGQVSTADIVGTVTDPAGAVISGATVTVENLDTGDKRTIPTNAAGDFLFTLLPSGRYTVT